MNKFRGKLINITGTQLMFSEITGRLPATIMLPAIGEAIDFGISHLGEMLVAEVKNGIIMSLIVWDSSQEDIDDHTPTEVIIDPLDGLGNKVC